VISKDGGLLLTGGWDGYFGHSGGIKLWDPRTGALVAEHGKPNEVPWSASLTPDGRYAVAAYFADPPALRGTDVIAFWTGHIAQAFNPDSDRRYPSCAVLPDGRRVLSAYSDGGAFVWELLSGKVLWHSSTGGSADFVADTPSNPVAVSPDGRLFALTDTD